MTVYDWAVVFLKERGMWPSEAAAVVERAFAHPALTGARARWGEAWDDYPAPSRVLLVDTLIKCGLAYIEEHEPRVWYRPLFDGTIKQ